MIIGIPLSAWFWGLVIGVFWVLGITAGAIYRRMP